MDLSGGERWSSPQTLQLLPTELLLVDTSSGQLSGRLSLEKMSVTADERGRSFMLRTAATGICLLVDADSSSEEDQGQGQGQGQGGKSLNQRHGSSSSSSSSNNNSNSVWLLAIRRQISFIDNQKLKMKTCPKEEQLPQGNTTYRDRLTLYYSDGQFPSSLRAVPRHGSLSASMSASVSGDGADEGTAGSLRWTAPPVDGLTDEYLHQLIFPHKLAPNPNPPSSNLSASSGGEDEGELMQEFVNEQLLFGLGLESGAEVPAGLGRSSSSAETSLVSRAAVPLPSVPSTGSEGAGRVLRHADGGEVSSAHPPSPPSALHQAVAAMVPSSTASISSGSGSHPSQNQNQGLGQGSGPASSSVASGGGSVSSGSSGSAGQGHPGGSLGSGVPPAAPLSHLARRGAGGLSTSSTTTSSSKRSLINPKFILTVLKGITHRFVLVLECERRRDVVDLPFIPPRFTVGGELRRTPLALAFQ